MEKQFQIEMSISLKDFYRLLPIALKEHEYQIKNNIIDIDNGNYDYSMEDFLDRILSDKNSFKLTKEKELYVFCRPQKDYKSFFNTYNKKIGSRLCFVANKRGYKCTFDDEGVCIYPLQQPSL